MHLFILCISFWTALMILDLPMVILCHSWPMWNCLMDPKTSPGVDTEAQTQTRGGRDWIPRMCFVFICASSKMLCVYPWTVNGKRVTNSKRTKTNPRQWFNVVVGRRECRLCSWLTYVRRCALEKREVNATLPRGLTVKEKKSISRAATNQSPSEYYSQLKQPRSP